MATIRMVVRGVTLDTHTNRSLHNLSNPTKILRQAALEIESRIKRAFGQAGRNRGFGQWEPTMQPNVPAIAKRVSQGKQPLRKYLGGRKMPLVDTETLRNSIKGKVSGNTIVIGTPLNYARVNHEGGTSQVRNRIPEMIRRGDRRAVQALQTVRRAGFEKAAGVLANEEVIDVNHIARPFLNIDQEDIQLIQDLIMKEMSQQSE